MSFAGYRLNLARLNRLGKVAYLFPGQGSQKVGMGSNLYTGSPEAKTVFDTADALLGYSLTQLCFEGPEDQLRQTIYTQPALYVSSCAALAALTAKWDQMPFACAGHSIGEYAAIVAAGSIEFEKGLALVEKRAELMHTQAQSRPGTMAAILGIDPQAAVASCEAARAETGKIVTVANYNCPGQIVISGEVEAVLRAGEIAKERGAKRVLPLPVSGGFHSPLMVAVGDLLYQSLRNALFQQANVPVVTNINAEYTTSGADFAPLLTMQVSGSVRWQQSIELLISDGVDLFIEFGSGDVLAGLLKRIDKSVRCVSIQNMATLEEAVALLNENEQLNAKLQVIEKLEPKPHPAIIYHIAHSEIWQAAKPTGKYQSPALVTEGFVHCSTIEQVVQSANGHFRARTGLTLLQIESSRLDAPLRYEASASGKLFPHIYGEINVDAVLGEYPFEPSADGRFALPVEL